MSDSKSRIIAVATRRFAVDGYDGTSLAHIAGEVGMKKPSLLYHFPSKEDLREAVLKDLLERWQTRLPEVLARSHSGSDRFTALYDEVHDFFEADPTRAFLVMREVVDRPRQTRERLGQSIRPWLQLLTAAIDEGKSAGRVRADVDPEAYLVQCIVMIVGSFVAADLGAEVFGGRDGARWAERQRNEARRMAQEALFLTKI